MYRLLEIAIYLLAMGVGAVGILFGLANVSQLVSYAAGAANGPAWQIGELGRRVTLVNGPIFMGLFTVVGLAWHLVSTQAIRKRMREFPGQPWMWQSDWAAKSIQLSNRSTIGITIIASTLYGLVVVPMGVYLASLKNAGLVYAFLGAVGFFLLIFFRLLWVNRRWNGSNMRLETLPGVIGGRFAGEATLPEAFAEGTVFRVTLRCEMTRSVNSKGRTTDDLTNVALGTERTRGSHSHTYTQTVFETHHLITVDPALLASETTVLPISFDVPPNLPSSGKQPRSPTQRTSHRTRIVDYCNWRVQIKLEQAGDLREIAFEVPVFRVENDTTGNGVL